MTSTRANHSPRTTGSPAARASRLGLGLALGAALGLAALPVHAAPASAPTASPSAAADASAALEAGDLEAARDVAVAARKAEPTPERWADEARVHEARGDYAAAIKAWKGHLKALPEGAAEGRRELGEEKLRELRERARGAAPDEPASTHRDAIDKDRAARAAALRPKPPKPKPVPKPPPPKEKIVKKWYFWVTVAAIAASAAAITGIAIKASREEQADDLDPRGGPPPPPEGLGIRF